jgi:uncharacterized membrane protein
MNPGYVTLMLLLFLVLQILVQLAMKFGSQGANGMRSGRWWKGFAMANGVGATSMLCYKEIFRAFPNDPNLVVAIVPTICFLASQVVLSLVFRTRLTVVQCAGIALIAAGTALSCVR